MTLNKTQLKPRVVVSASNLPESAQARRAQRVLLIGTLKTLPQLRQMLATDPNSSKPAACILVRDPANNPVSPQSCKNAVADIPNLCSALNVDLALLCLPPHAQTERTRALIMLAELGIVHKTVTPIDDLLDLRTNEPETSVSTPSSVVRIEPSGASLIDLAALIGRDPHQLDTTAVSRILTSKRVLITGAGGSIGSELTRIVASFNPESITLMERSENALFEIDRWLSTHAANITRNAIMHDVVDEAGTLEHLQKIKPHVVFHAAAHKHVPLMEQHPIHAIKNNVFGTRSIAEASFAVGVERFVMISTDKAVNPTSIMGATKRLAERFVQSLNVRAQARQSNSCFSMVRFGNVLGSACSVLPIWTAQLAEGGPITITDQRMTRYFMTINEAATLVIQSAALSDTDPAQAQVFVLDMGEPLQILDLAQRLIQMHGSEPVIRTNPDAGPAKSNAEIVFTGIRPGEKLHESLSYDIEQLEPTDHPGIRAWQGAADGSFDPDVMLRALSALKANDDKDRVWQVLADHLGSTI